MTGSRPYVSLTNGPPPGKARTTSPNGDDDEVRVGDRSIGDHGRLDAREVDVAQVPRVAARVADRGRLVGVATGERHRVPVVGEEPREGCPPRPSPDHDDVHSDRWKSMDTGTPWSSKRARSSFSTQKP